jgi:hypothetical protein
VETGSDGRRRDAIAVLSASDDVPQLAFTPAAALTTADGEMARFPLARARLSMPWSTEHQEFALVAEPAGDTLWIHTPGFSVALSAGVQPLELTSKDGVASSPIFAPELRSVAIPFDDGTITEFGVPTGTPIYFQWPDARRASGDASPALLTLGGETPTLRLDRSLRGRVSVLRCADLLQLTFSYEGLEFYAGLFQWYLHAPEHQPPARLVVEFPPQAIAEEAFFAADPNIEPDVPLPDFRRDHGVGPTKEDLNTIKPGQPTEEPKLPAMARMAGRSRLVFSVPAGVSIPLTLKGLLDWRRFVPVLDPRAVPAGTEPMEATEVTDPRASNVSYIEAPYRLLLSPTDDGAWAHATDPVTQKTAYAELWHTRLATARRLADWRGQLRAPIESVAANRVVRAIWSPDYKPLKEAPPSHYPSADEEDAPPFRSSLDRRDRHEIVHLSSHFRMREYAMDHNYLPGAIGAELLMLSSLGAGLRVLGQWDPPAVCPTLPCPTDPKQLQVFTVEEWRHRAAMGRDDYVRVLYKGYLFPFGHRASLVKVTERQFEQTRDGRHVAVLRQRMYISVRRPQMQYPAPGQPFGGRDLPFTRIELLTSTTQNLDKPQPPPDFPALPGSPLSQQAVFWPTVRNAPFAFTFRGTDHEGNEWTFAVPLLFVDAEVALRAPELVVSYYNEVETRRPWADGRGNRVAYAPSDTPANTAFATQSLRFCAHGPTEDTSASRELLYKIDQPAFYPGLDLAQLRIPAIEQLTGRQDTVDARYHGAYAAVGFATERNQGEIYLAFPRTADLTFGDGSPSADRAGGVITPNANLVALSRRQGPVGGPRGTNNTSKFLDEVARAAPHLVSPAQRGVAGASVDPAADVLAGRFDPVKFFAGAVSGAKLLGAVNLWDIVRPLAESTADSLGLAPRVICEATYATVAQARHAIKPLRAVLAGVPTFARPRLGPHIALVEADLAALDRESLTALPQLVAHLHGLARETSAILRDPLTLAGEEVLQLREAATALSSKLEALSKEVGTLVVPRARLGDLILALPAETQGTARGREVLAFIARTRQEWARRRDAANAVLKEIEAQGTATVATMSAMLQAPASALADLLDTWQQMELIATLVEHPRDATELATSLYRLLASRGVVAPDAVARVRDRFTHLRGQFDKELAPGTALAREVAAQETVILSCIDEWTRAMGTEGVTRAVALSEVVEHAARGPLQVVDAVLALRAAVATLEPRAGDPTNTIKELDDTLLAVLRVAVGGTAATQYATVAGQLGRTLGLIAERRAQELQTAFGAAAAVNASLETYRAALQLLDEFRTLVQLGVWLQGSAGLRADEIRRQAEALRSGIATYRAAIGRVRDAVQDISHTTLHQYPALRVAFFPPALDAAFQTVAHSPDSEALVRALSAATAELATTWRDLTKQLSAPLNAIAQPAQLNAMSVLGQLREELERQLAEIAIPTSVVLRYDWTPTIRSFPADRPLIEVRGPTGGRENLSIRTRVATRLVPNFRDPQLGVEVDLNGSLRDFALHLFPRTPFLSISFAALEFKSRSGERPRFVAKISGVEFGEQLGFVRELQKLLSPSEGPFVELYDVGVRAGYRFAVNTIPVGAFILSDLRISVSMELPFDGRPMRAILQVSEPARPFILTSGIYGGGGSLALTFGAHGMERLQGSLEFGVNARLRIGPASGYGFVRAGIYFSFDSRGALCCGFVHAGGYLDLLGIISMSIYMNVSIWYQNRTDTGESSVYGTARIEVGFKIGFFKMKVRITASYTFAGSKTQPTSLAREDNKLLYEPSRVRGSLGGGFSERDLGMDPEIEPGSFEYYRQAFAW